LRRLRRIVAYAVAEVPLYARRFREAGLERGDVDVLEDVTLLPVLERRDVIDHSRELVAARHASSLVLADASWRKQGEPLPFARLRRHRLVRNSSSGSTGTPTRFYDDGTVAALAWAHELRLKRWYGLQPGVPEARLARLSAGYVAASRAVRLRRLLWGQLLLPGINLSREDHAASLAQMLEFRPRILWGVTSALTGLAEFAHAAYGDALPHRPDLVVAWAAPLYEHERALLEEVFGCAVASSYGTREVGHIAGTCPNKNFHINQESYLVEALAPPGVPGELLVTTLQPSPMPFIRYRIGDAGTLAHDRCSCGRGLQVLSDLAGRTGDLFRTIDGRTISPNYWCRIFRLDEPSRTVRQFQIVYDSERSARVRIVPRPGYTAATEAVIREAIEQSFGHTLRPDFDYTTHIPPAPSGKYPLVVNHAHRPVHQQADPA
jgi:phenylacetate-CoA ligase